MVRLSHLTHPLLLRPLLMTLSTRPGPLFDMAPRAPMSPAPPRRQPPPPPPAPPPAPARRGSHTLAAPPATSCCWWWWGVGCRRGRAGTAPGLAPKPTAVWEASPGWVPQGQPSTRWLGKYSGLQVCGRCVGRHQLQVGAELHPLPCQCLRQRPHPRPRLRLRMRPRVRLQLHLSQLGPHPPQPLNLPARWRLPLSLHLAARSGHPPPCWPLCCAQHPQPGRQPHPGRHTSHQLC